MSLLTKLKKELTPEMYNAITDALGDDFDWDVVPRTRLNKVIKQRNQLREQLEDDGANSDDSDDDEGSGTTGKDDPDTAGTNKKDPEVNTQEEIDKAVNAIRLEYAVKDKLKEANARDVDLVFGLIDSTKVSIGEDGTLSGLDGQIKNLTESKDFLFESVPGGTGKDGGESDNSKGSLDAAIEGIFANYGVTSDEE